MIKDVYAMNIETGEIVPTKQAIHEFYKTHKWYEAWTDEWQPTDMEVEDSYLDNPLQCFLDSVNF